MTKDYASARADMSIFIDNFIETGTRLQKDVRLVKALMDLIQQDDSIDDDVEFLIGQDGQAVRKDWLDDLDRVCLPSFLLGRWHFIVVKRKKNKIGRDTYDIWCPENGSGPREYQGAMESITRKIDVYLLNADEMTETSEDDAQAGQTKPEGHDADGDGCNQDQTQNQAPNLQQINNPFTFIQNGANSTQIGYIANQTIIKK